MLNLLKRKNTLFVLQALLEISNKKKLSLYFTRAIPSLTCSKLHTQTCSILLISQLSDGATSVSNMPIKHSNKGGDRGWRSAMARVVSFSPKRMERDLKTIASEESSKHILTIINGESHYIFPDYCEPRSKKTTHQLCLDCRGVGT